jgi:hypothetical protein
MSKFVMSIIRGHGAKELSISSMEFGIEENTGTLNGNVEVKSPAKVTIGMTCILDNHNDRPDMLKLTALDITTKAGIRASIGLIASNVVGKTKESLQDPNVAFKSFLDSQFNPKGVTLTELGLHFNKSTLVVNLRGKHAALKG